MGYIEAEGLGEYGAIVSPVSASSFEYLQYLFYVSGVRMGMLRIISQEIHRTLNELRWYAI
jgi:hypothetical protein